MESVHYSVMAGEVLQHLVPSKPHDTLIDATLGEGGHSALFLERYPDLQVIGLDADGEALSRARRRLERFGDRVRFVQTWFDDYFCAAETAPDIEHRPGLILFDLGISSYHLLLSGRGFTFRNDEPLDMRLSPSGGKSAAELVNTLSERELADVIFEYGEERYARRIAQRIVRERSNHEIGTTAELAEVTSRAVPSAYRHGRIHPATRTFQALRIVVNRELDRLSRGLESAVCRLRTGGRIGVISFHSLEDRITKQTLRRLAGQNTDPGIASPGVPPRYYGGDRESPTSMTGVRVVTIVTKKPLRPSEAEVAENTPSRSALLRVAEKVGECVGRN